MIGTVHPGVPPPGGWRRHAKGGGWHHRHLTLLSGIQRIQIYRDGVGVTVQMGHPPNRTQLEALRSAYAMTPMDRFAAEIDRGERTLVTLGSFGKLAELVRMWDPVDPAGVLELEPRLAGLYDPAAEPGA